MMQLRARVLRVTDLCEVQRRVLLQVVTLTLNKEGALLRICF